MASIFNRNAACTALALGLLAASAGAATTTTSAASPTTTTVAASPTTTTAAPSPTTTAASLAAVNQIAASETFSFLDGKVKLGWTVFGGADSTSAADDVIEVDLETNVNGVYAGFGTATEKMTGKFFVCWVDASTGVAGCADYSGSGVTPSPIAAITQIVSSTVVATGGFTIKVRVPASHLSLATSGPQRAIVATGAVGAYHGANRAGVEIVPYLGALATETTTTAQPPATTTLVDAVVTTTAASTTAAASSVAASASAILASAFALAAMAVA
jgi:hypothetical protein